MRIQKLLLLFLNLRFFPIHYFVCKSAFTLNIMSNCSALLVTRWCTYNGQKVACGTLDTSHPQWSLSWLPSGWGGAAKLFSNLVAEDSAAHAIAHTSK